MKATAIEIAGRAIKPGENVTLAIPVAELYTHTPMELMVHVRHGRRPGPVLFVSAAVHGDEINGVEIIRRLLALSALRHLRGTLICVPIVNVFGFINRSRYLPDRRDLNRSLPGQGKGSLAGRLGKVFFDEIVRQANLGIDLHTAAIHRDNLPQVRTDLDNPELRILAEAFAAPVIVHSSPIAGSLREAAAAHGIPVMVYEAGEALRFDELSIRVGLRGIVNVMRNMAMLKAARSRSKLPTLLRSTTWVRAEKSGILRATVKLGAAVSKDSHLGIIADPSGTSEITVTAPTDGVVIGRTQLPLVYAGEALFHIGRTRSAERVESHLESIESDVSAYYPELSDEPPIL